MSASPPIQRIDCKRIVAFTLLETLAVVTVVVILAAVTLPALRKATAKAHAASSMSNLRQLYTYFQSYAADNGYEVPIAGYRDTSQFLSWDLSLAAYAATQKDLEKSLRDPADRLARQWPEKSPRTYSMVRTQGGGFYSEFQRNIKNRFIGLEKPNRTLLLVQRPHPTNVAFGDSCAVTDGPSQQLEYGANLYGGKFIYLFADGHTEFLSPEETIGTGSLSSPRGAWTTNPND